MGSFVAIKIKTSLDFKIILIGIILLFILLIYYYKTISNAMYEIDNIKAKHTTLQKEVRKTNSTENLQKNVANKKVYYINDTIAKLSKITLYLNINTKLLSTNNNKYKYKASGYLYSITELIKYILTNEKLHDSITFIMLDIKQDIAILLYEVEGRL